MGVFIVAELSANHGGDLSVAKESLCAAKECGVDAVKLQTYTADDLTIDCKSEIFRIKGTKWDGQYLYDLYKRAAMPMQWHFELFALAKKLDLTCFSTPFSRAGVEFLARLNNPIYKIASFEVVDLELVESIAKQGKPVIISSGIATNSELKEAISLIKSQGIDNITLLKCVSAYPAQISDMNLLEMRALGEKHNVKYGLSDHSKGNLAGIMAVALGASVIEKHFILDRKIASADAHFSADKAEFAEFVKAIRNAESALGSENTSDLKQGREFARSLFVVKDIKKGQILRSDNICAIRPNNGLKPKFLKDILGRKAKRDLPFGKPLEWDDFE